MANKIFDIFEVDTNSISATDRLIVNFKKSVFFFAIFFGLFFIIVIIMLFRLHKYWSSFILLGITIINSFNQFGWFPPKHIPYLSIDSFGIGYKKKQISWHEIEKIKYQIVNTHDNISSDFLCIKLKSNKNISVDVTAGAIDSSIEIIAAQIKKYWI